MAVATLTKAKSKLFENPLTTNSEYLEAETLLNDLKEQKKRLSMSLSFDAVEQNSFKSNNEAVEKLCAGENLDNINAGEMLTDKQLCERKIRLLGTAIARKEQELQRKRTEIWRETIGDPAINKIFADVWNELLESMEGFRSSLIKLETLRRQFSLTGIEEMFWQPAWKLDSSWYRRFGVTMSDGRGELETLIKNKRKAWKENE